MQLLVIDYIIITVKLLSNHFIHKKTPVMPQQQRTELLSKFLQPTNATRLALIDKACKTYRQTQAGRARHLCLIMINKNHYYVQKHCHLQSEGFSCSAVSVLLFQLKATELFCSWYSITSVIVEDSISARTPEQNTSEVINISSKERAVNIFFDEASFVVSACRDKATYTLLNCQTS